MSHKLPDHRGSSQTPPMNIPFVKSSHNLPIQIPAVCDVHIKTLQNILGISGGRPILYALQKHFPWISLTPKHPLISPPPHTHRQAAGVHHRLQVGLLHLDKRALHRLLSVPVCGRRPAVSKHTSLYIAAPCDNKSVLIYLNCLAVLNQSIREYVCSQRDGQHGYRA